MLIDSTFYIEALRRRQDVRFLLRPWLLAGQLWTCGVIRAELVRGVRSPRIKADLNDLFDVMAEVPTETGLWRATAELAWELDRRGAILPLTDLIIAACALQVGAPMVTLDAHFSPVPRLQTRRSLQ
jgi:predicted nucleic acid-binding protein